MSHQSQILFSDEDADLRLINWRGSSMGYARTGKRGVCAHTMVIQRMTGVTPSKINGLVCDHINRNPLDNRRENLRLVNKSQNALNTEYSRNSKGYAWAKWAGKWKAYLRRDGQNIHLGYFTSEADAIAAVRQAKL